MKRRLEKVLHRVFQVGIVVKGLDGILEVLGDAMLFMATQPQIARFVGLLTKEEHWGMDKEYDGPRYGNGEIAKFLYELR